MFCLLAGNRTNDNKLVLRPLIQVNPGEPEPETYNSYSNHITIITTAVTPIPFDRFPPSTAVHSIT